MVMLAAVDSLNDHHQGELGCRPAKHTHTLLRHRFVKMQLQLKLRRHKNAHGSRNWVLLNLILLRQLFWKLEKDVLGNTKILK